MSYYRTEVNNNDTQRGGRYMNKTSDENWLTKTLYVAQILFVIVISLFTAWNSYLSYNQFKLMYRPFVGVVNVDTTRLLGPNKKDTYANTIGVLSIFWLENTGSIPAKNAKFDVVGKLGSTILPRNEPVWDEGVIMPPHTKYFIRTTLGKNDLMRLIEGGEKLIYSIKISYSDLEGYKSQEYTSYQEYELVSKDPPAFLVHPVTRNKWEAMR